MTPSLRALGPVLLVVLGVGVAATATASAHKLSINKGASVDLAAATSTGALFGTSAGILEAECEEERLSAPGVPNNAATITVTPSFTECTAEPLGAAPFDTTGCTFTLSGSTTNSSNTSGGTRTTAPFGIACGAGAIKITASGCTISIPTQSELHGVNYDNQGAGDSEAIKLTLAVDGIKYTTPGGFFCSLAGLSTSGSDGYLTQEAVLHGFEPGTVKSVGVTMK